jgi:hypothetical protein
MNGLIGNSVSAKFIFLAIDDESLIPSKKEMKEYFPNHEMAVYKAWGYFKDSFNSIQGYMKIRKDGLLTYRDWDSRYRYISHAIRLNNQCESNSFFNLKYQHICVGTYHLSNQLMNELNDLLKVTDKFNRIIDDAIGFGKTLDLGKEFVNSNNLTDTCMSNPCYESFMKLLENYGSGAKNQLEEKFDSWRDRAIWI